MVRENPAIIVIAAGNREGTRFVVTVDLLDLTGINGISCICGILCRLLFIVIMFEAEICGQSDTADDQEYNQLNFLSFHV